MTAQVGKPSSAPGMPEPARGAQEHSMRVGADLAASSRTWCTRRTHMLTGSSTMPMASSTSRRSPNSGLTRCAWYPSASRTTCAPILAVD